MNKKVNTVIFILCATLVNIVIALVSFIILMLLYGRFIMALMPEFNHSWGFALIFIASIVISFLAYRFLIKYFLKRIDVEKYFDPLFIRKYKKN